MEGLTTVTSAISAVFTAAIGMVSEVVDTITSNPLLLFFVAIPFVGIGIGIFRRLVSSARG